MIVQKSEIDQSVNFIHPRTEGFIETRYVRKVDDYFVCYLSSQTGCNRGCKFCHLTTTGQTSFVHVDNFGYQHQSQIVLSYYQGQVEHGQAEPARKVHFNFMARGEPLANPFMINQGDEIIAGLAARAREDSLLPKFNISTILPIQLKKPLEEIFPAITPTIYYSLYSIRDDFRQKWLPGAMPVREALVYLKRYQDFSKKIVKIHHAFIKGENGDRQDVIAMCDLLDEYGLIYEFNLVRYNPFSPNEGTESSQDAIDRNLEIIGQRTRGKVQTIPRVGFDINASCGMFTR
jgi:23S rRNA (adenine2503-C2)-methyltransferase